MDKMQTQELISALADGQLQGEAFARGRRSRGSAIRRRSRPGMTYHLIGDVLRSGELGRHGTLPARSWAACRFACSRSSPGRRPQADESTPTAPAAPRKSAANDASFRWKLVAGFASLAAWRRSAGSVAGASPASRSRPSWPASQRRHRAARRSERGVDDPRPAAG